jgi:hypothetical protein
MGDERACDESDGIHGRLSFLSLPKIDPKRRRFPT